MNEQDLSLIERYFAAELSEAERLAFENRMTDDADFKDDVLLYSKGMAAIRLYGRDMLKKKLQDTPLIALESPSHTWRWALAAVLVLAAFIGVYWWPKTQSLPPTPTVLTPAPPPGTARQSTHPPPFNQPIANRQIDTKKLFADAFKPYSPPDQNGSVKSADTTHTHNIGTNKTTVDTLKQLAKEGKYAESLSVFEHLSKEQQSQSVALFLKANSLLALGRTDEAAVLFEEVASNKQSVYASYAKWYAALCALKKGNLQKAKKWLQELASGADASKTQREEAVKLLNNLR